MLNTPDSDLLLRPKRVVKGVLLVNRSCSILVSYLLNLLLVVVVEPLHLLILLICQSLRLLQLLLKLLNPFSRTDRLAVHSAYHGLILLLRGSKLLRRIDDSVGPIACLLLLVYGILLFEHDILLMHGVILLLEASELFDLFLHLGL